MDVNQDIDHILRSWEFKPGKVQARLAEAAGGREVIQLRLDLGLLQLEPIDRPDGMRPHGQPTYFAYLQQQADLVPPGGAPLVLTEEQCLEADREFVQFYHRRVCWLALHRYDRALVDADHTLAFMDFVRLHSPNEEYTQAHEQYRGFVVFQRTQAAAALAMTNGDAEQAVDAVRVGLERLHAFFTEHGALEQMDEDGMVRRLREMEKSLRREHGIEETLREQLARAVAAEDYETAARIRDELRKRI